MIELDVKDCVEVRMGSLLDFQKFCFQMYCPQNHSKSTSHRIRVPSIPGCCISIFKLLRSTTRSIGGLCALVVIFSSTRATAVFALASSRSTRSRSTGFRFHPNSPLNPFCTAFRMVMPYVRRSIPGTTSPSHPSAGLNVTGRRRFALTKKSSRFTSMERITFAVYISI
ncbi:hypothetical protein EJ08DRAFT_475779 [Tothia fuscella]|uniref:Uncharacterized protein n=1 Tax=Tothia fuscella TaxID=1048955 RepID=A0A9P4TUT5_9PEZI|nr:hypothetical protein EJ08DRAFT_475779 [Tothia fuscella]